MRTATNTRKESSTIRDLFRAENTTIQAFSDSKEHISITILPGLTILHSDSATMKMVTSSTMVK